MVCYFLNILITTEFVKILIRLGLIEFFSALSEGLLEFGVVSVKVDFTLPYRKVDLLVF